jgi:hypothetical protein
LRFSPSILTLVNHRVPLFRVASAYSSALAGGGGPARSELGSGRELRAHGARFFGACQDNTCSSADFLP